MSFVLKRVISDLFQIILKRKLVRLVPPQIQITFLQDKLDNPGYQSNMDRFRRQRDQVEAYLDLLEHQQIAPQFEFLAE